VCNHSNSITREERRTAYTRKCSDIDKQLLCAGGGPPNAGDGTGDELVGDLIIET
jgi:hypothetical protein